MGTPGGREDNQGHRHQHNSDHSAKSEHFSHKKHGQGCRYYRFHQGDGGNRAGPQGSKSRGESEVGDDHWPKDKVGHKAYSLRGCDQWRSGHYQNHQEDRCSGTKDTPGDRARGVIPVRELSKHVGVCAIGEARESGKSNPEGNISHSTPTQFDFRTRHQGYAGKRGEGGYPPGKAWATAINPPLQEGCGERTETQGDDVSERYARHRHARVKSQRIRNRAKRPHDEEPPGAAISPEREGGPAAPQGKKDSTETHGDRTDSQWGDLWSQKVSCGAGGAPQSGGQHYPQYGALHDPPFALVHWRYIPTTVGDIMTSQTHAHWLEIRKTIVVSQMAPTALLITTVALLQFGLGETDLAVRIATAGILLASGILGALVQFQSASEAESLATEDSSLRSSARWLWVIKYVTPTIFVIIFGALMVALFG